MILNVVTVDDKDKCLVTILSYEPADLTVHPPQKKNYRGWVHFFRIGV